ncbi:MAG: InlB B-repeat-containing protein [Lachnospiraceae bacterium]
MRKIAGMLCMVLMISLFGGINIGSVHAEAKVESIKVTKFPDKCAYNIGEGFSSNGIVVKAKMSNGKTEVIANSELQFYSGVELTQGRPFEQEGWKPVTVTYKGAKAYFGLAVFDPKKEYSITFDSDGGNKIEAHKIDASTKAFKFPIPTKKGFQFIGWYHSNGGKYSGYEPGMGPNVHLKAQWGHSITYNANGGTGKMKKDITEADYTYPKCKFKKAGYKFVGWSFKKAATGYDNFFLVGARGDYLARGNKNVTLYAQWVKPAKYKISYVSLNGAKLPSNAIRKYTSGKATALPQLDSKGTKFFEGWKITCKGKTYGPFLEVPPFMTGNIKLTPVYAAFEG